MKYYVYRHVDVDRFSPRAADDLSDLPDNVVPLRRPRPGGSVA